MVKANSRTTLLVLAMILSGCAGSTSREGQTTAAGQAQLRFVPASRRVFAECHATAHAVRYAVPCPTRIPVGLNESGIVAAAGKNGKSTSWREWIFGSTAAGAHHLVITGSPSPLRNDAKVVNGPAWYPKARVRPLGWATINGRRMHVVFVPEATNDGSAFAHHVVLIWTERGHTYGIGFHAVDGLGNARNLDVALARGIEMVHP